MQETRCKCSTSTKGGSWLCSVATPLADKTNRNHLRKASNKTDATALTSISRLEKDLVEYWAALPTVTYCRDLAPDGPLFRFNIHLALTYHLARTFIGRVFVLSVPHASDRYAPPVNDITASLVSGCVQSALDIVELCQRLEDEIGLARASYTEYTSCRAALLVILAQRLHQRSARLARASKQGIRLLKQMSVGFYSDHTDEPAIEAMELAIRRLDTGTEKQNSEERSEPGASAYDQFRAWALLWKNEGSGPTNLPQPSPNTLATEVAGPLKTPSTSNFAPLPDFGWDMYSPSMPLEISDFAFLLDDSRQ